MIANARMYSVTARVGELWRRLLEEIAVQAKLPLRYIEHPEPEPIGELWSRADLGAVFMCGLPYARSDPRPALVAAPVPLPASFRGRPLYWSELVVRADGRFEALQDTFGTRLALTTPQSQSGYAAALHHLMEAAMSLGAAGKRPLYKEIIAPQITPLGALNAVIEGLADVAPIDSFAFCLLQQYRPDLISQVRVIARTASTPIPPLVGSHAGQSSLESALLAAHEKPSLQPVLADLLLERFVRPDPASYDVLRRRFEAATGFWRTRPLAASAHPAFAALADRPPG